MTPASPSALTDLLHALRARYRLVHVDETQSVLLLYVERLLRAMGCEALRLRHLASGAECAVAVRPPEGDAPGRLLVALEYTGGGATGRLVEIGAELGAGELWLLGWDQAPPLEPAHRVPDPDMTQQLVLPPALAEELARTANGSAATPQRVAPGPRVLRRTLREAVFREGRTAMAHALRVLVNRWEAAPESGSYVELRLRTGAPEPRPLPAEKALRGFLGPGERGGPPLFLLVGAPGAGKSTLLHHLAVELAREHLGELAHGAVVPPTRAPVLLSVPASDPAPDLDRLLEEAVPGMGARLLRLWMELGLCALLLDGPIALASAQRLLQQPTLLPDAPPRAVIAVRARYFVQGQAEPLALLEEAVRGGWELGYLEPLSDELLQQYLLLRLPDPVARSAALAQLARSDNLRRLCRRPGLLAALTDGGAGPPLLGEGVLHGAPSPPLPLLHQVLRPDWLEGVAGDQRIERTAREVLARVLARRLLQRGGAPVPWWDLLPEIGAEVPGEPDSARLLLHVLRALDDTMFIVEPGPGGPDDPEGPRLRFALASAADYFTGEDISLRLGVVDVSTVGACVQRAACGQLRAAALSRSGRLCATGADDGTVRIWEAQSGFLLRVLSGHQDPVTALCFVEDDARLVSASQDYTLCIWDVATGRLAQRLVGHSDAVTALGYAPEAALLCSGSADGSARIWQLPEGRCIQSLRPPTGAGVTAVALSPDGLLCAVASQEPLVHVFHAFCGELLAVLGGHSGPVRSLALSPDGRLCASGGDDHSIRLTEVHTGNLLQALRWHEQAVTALAFSPDGELLASGSADQSVRVCVVPAPGEHTPARLLHELRGHAGTVHAVAFPPGAPLPRASGRRATRPPPPARGPRLLLTAGGDGAAHLWDAAAGQLLRPLDGSAAGAPVPGALQVRCVAASPDGELLAAGGADGLLRLWDPRTGALLRELRGHDGAARCVAFSPDGELLASGGEDQALGLWDPHLGEPLDRFAGHAGEITSVAFSPDGYLLASASADGTVRLREAAGGLTLRTLRAAAPVTQVVFSPDGRRLAAAATDGTIHVWETAGGPPLFVLRRHLARVTALCASPDGRLLASAGDDQLVRIWDAATGRAIHALWGHLDDVAALAFSPDGELLASAAWDQSVRLWEPRTGRCLAALPGGAGWLRTLCFLPDGRTLVAGGQEGILLWQVPAGRLLAQLLALGDGWLALVPAEEGTEGSGAPRRYVFYAAEPATPPCLRMSDGLLSYPASGWARLCHRPQVVAAALAQKRPPDLEALRAELLAAPVPLPVLESSGSRATPSEGPPADPLPREISSAYDRPLTGEDVLRGDAADRGELDRGALVPVGPVPYGAGRVAGRLHALLGRFVLSRNLGDVPGGDTGYLLERDPDVLRAPDVSFVSRERVPQGGTAGFFTGAPDLAAEVVSPANPWELVEQKAHEYLRTGARLVWIVDPETRTVHVHESPVRVRILGETEQLSGGAVLPGFSVPVRDLFG